MGKKGQRKFTYHFFSAITRIKSIMLLIIFLGLIAKLTLVSGQSYDQTFDWNKVGIIVLARFLKQAALKTAAWFFISIVIPLTNSQ
jgi:hypothetical protein